MSALEWAANGLLLLLLCCIIPLAWRLDRRLADLRMDGSGLKDGARGIAEATEAAETTLARLRATTEQSGRLMSDRVVAAEKLRDDLAFLAERSEALADRLDALVRQGRPLASEAPPPQAANQPRSEAERELLRALKGLR